MEEQGKFVWIEDDEYGWLPAKIIDVINSNLKLQIFIDGKIIEKFQSNDQHYPEVHPSCLSGVDDLLLLGDLDQQTLLHNTRVRHSKDSIYTFIGMPILIAMNPYKHINIYNDEIIKYYKDYFLRLKINPNGIVAPRPHLYHIAEAAYQDMINEKKNQSVIISGESGSGKTQSTKIILKYLAVSSLHSFDNFNTDSNDKGIPNEDISVEKQVLDSNPLLEAFGNAKTVKNNNSSRFGKFIQINFSDNGKILSAKIFNYLLEKSRITHINPEERNYHIFYQLIKGSDEREKKRFNIKNLEYFNYLKNGCFDVDDTDDKANFIETKECMMKLKFKPEEISYIFTVLMGILYLGNVNFSEGETDKSKERPIIIDPDNQSDFAIASDMLGLDQIVLLEILTIKKFKDPTTGNHLKRKISLEKAYFSRDAVCKTVYSRVFDYILKKVNFAISNPDEMKNRKNVLKIGLLDIFGFENFTMNSFEQLCINYANERLQQYFNNHIFKMEQEEYKKEGIDYTTVEFKDNNEIIQMIDDNKNSIFSILDSEALLSNGCDENFEKKVYQYLSSNENLAERVEEYVGINHYAGEVYYFTEGFLKKNIDQLTVDILDALEKSKNKLIKKVFEKKDVKNNTIPAKLQSDSLSKQFKKQLDDLLKMLNQSNPRYIKCIKPNSQKKPRLIESFDVMDQLLSAGVLEAIKIRKQGYSIRRTNEEFVKRYLKLYPDIGKRIKVCEEKDDFRDLVTEMCSFFSKNEDMKKLFDYKSKLIQLGVTKVFMKEEVKDLLEFKLNKIKYIQIIQNNFRRYKVQKIVKKKLKSIRKIQGLYRGFIARIYVNSLKLCVKIQRSFRRFIKKKFVFSNLKLLATEFRRKKENEKRRESEQKNYIIKNENNVNDFNLNNKDNSQNKSSDNKENSSYEKEQKNLNKRKFNNNGKKNKNEWESSSLLRKESLGDISNTDVQLINDLKNIGKKNQNHKKREKQKNQFSELLTNNIGSLLDNEIKLSLKNLKEELENTKKEKENLQKELQNKNDELRKKNLELDSVKGNTANNAYKFHLENLEKMDLVEKANFLTDQERSRYQEEIRRLKNELFDREGQLDVMNLKIEELSKNNKDLNKTVDTMNEQSLKKREKIDREMENLSQQMRELENKKSEFSVQLIKLAGKFGQNINIEEIFKSLNRANFNEKDFDNYSLILGNNSNLTNHQIRKSILSHSQLNKEDNNITQEGKKVISDLKNENKNLYRKIEDLKAKYEREIINLKTESDYKDQRIKDLENLVKKKESIISQLSNENFSCKSEIDFTRLKLDNFSNKTDKIDEWERDIIRFKKDFELIMRKKDLELNDLRETLDTVHLNLDRSKRMENVLKNEIKNREGEIENLKEKLNQKLSMIDNINDQILQLKKENINFKSSLTLGEVEFKNKYELENQLRNQEMKLLKENLKKYDKYIFELKENLQTKKQVITNIKQMNVILCDLARIKKGEIQCLETLQYNNSENIRRSLYEIRKSEKELLIKLNEISTFGDYSDSEEDLSDDMEDDYEN